MTQLRVDATRTFTRYKFSSINLRLNIFKESYTFQLVLTLRSLESYLETDLMILNSYISHVKTKYIKDNSNFVEKPGFLSRSRMALPGNIETT